MMQRWVRPAIEAPIGLPLPPLAGDDNGIRMGTNEITRPGMTVEEMETVAGYVRRILVEAEPPARVGSEVVEFRRCFDRLRFVNPSVSQPA